MNKPDLNMMWRTWVRIGANNQLNRKILQDTIRQKMAKISQLQIAGDIDWYYFLYHLKPDDPSNAYFDVVFTTYKTNPEDFLPDFCVDIKKIEPIGEISGIDKTFMKERDIAEAWKIIGEQSEFIINLVRAHTEDEDIPLKQIVQFMHFFMNPLGLGHQSVFIPLSTRF